MTKKIFETDRLIEDFRKIVHSIDFSCEQCPIAKNGCFDVLFRDEDGEGLCEDEARFKEAIIKKYSREVEYDG